jgi:hypothetical protein
MLGLIASVHACILRVKRPERLRHACTQYQCSMNAIVGACRSCILVVQDSLGRARPDAVLCTIALEQDDRGQARQLCAQC